MFISPNFEVIADQDSEIVTAQLNDDGIVDRYLSIEDLKTGGNPIMVSDKIKKDRLLLCKLDSLKSMWLNSDGTITTER
jgi:hypothetical protein